MSRVERNGQRDDWGVVEHGKAELVRGILRRLPGARGDRSLVGAARHAVGVGLMTEEARCETPH